MLTSSLILVALFSFVVGNPQVQLGNTTLTGVEFAGVEFFGGIPFAKPPVGVLRLQPPALTTSLAESDFDASRFGPSCLQTDLPPDQISEDCLQLNVFRPSGIPANVKLPIMFWIFGGGFTTGSPSLYNATGLITKSVDRGTPVIFVSVNYRLGPLGFPQGAEPSAKKIINLGLSDIIAGLQWVQSNINSFGGDKEKVTIFGESAGATVVFDLALSSHIKGLARAAIAESTGFLPTFGPERGEGAWQTFVGAVPECASFVNTSKALSCLQSANTSSIFQGLQVSIPVDSGVSDTSWFPSVDGPGGLLPVVPSKLISAERLPMIIGNNRDEGTLFTPQDANSTNQIRDIFTGLSVPSLEQPPSEELKATINGLLELYPDIPALGSPFGTGNNTFGLNKQYKRLAALFGDFGFQALRRAKSRSMSASGIKVFGYQFTDPTATVPVQAAPGSLGVTHASELSYVFGPEIFGTPGTPSLSSAMQDYWISFAVSLDPNDGKGDERPYWPQYSPSNPTRSYILGPQPKNVTLNAPDHSGPLFRPAMMLCLSTSLLAERYKSKV